VELFLEEINERLIDEEKELKDYQAYLICKSITSKLFLLDKTQPQVKTYLMLQSHILEAEIGKKICIEHMP
jgi:hypothetical protein